MWQLERKTKSRFALKDGERHVNQKNDRNITLGDGKGKETDSPLSLKREHSPDNTLIGAQ